MFVSAHASVATPPTVRRADAGWQVAFCLDESWRSQPAAIDCWRDALVHPRPYVAAILARLGYVGLDFEPNSPALRELPGLLAEIARGAMPPPRGMRRFSSIGSLGDAQARRLGLTAIYDDFEPLPQSVAERLEIDAPLHAFAWNGPKRSKSSGWRGEVIASRLPAELAQRPEWRPPCRNYFQRWLSTSAELAADCEFIPAEVLRTRLPLCL